MRMAGERKRPSVVVRFSRQGGWGGQKKDGLRLLHCDKSEFSMTSNMTANIAAIINDVIGPQLVKFHNIHIIPCSYHKQKLSTQFLNIVTQPSLKPEIQPFSFGRGVGLWY